MTLQYKTLKEMMDRDLGVIGTPERDAFEAEVEEAIYTYNVGEAIRQARKQRNLTQQQLGELMGIKKAQVSKIENGHNLTISTLARALKAMGLKGSLDFGSIRIALY